MKKILQVLGTIIYSILASYLLWLFCHWVTPYAMGIGWFLFILYIFIIGGMFSVVIMNVAYWLSIPLAFLMYKNKVAKVINAIPFILLGFDAVLLPWRLDMDYGLLQYLIGISVSITYLIAFGSAVISPFRIEE